MKSWDFVDGEAALDFNGKQLKPEFSRSAKALQWAQCSSNTACFLFYLNKCPVIRNSHIT